MYLPAFLAFVFPLGPSAVVPSKTLTTDAQWAAIEACPRIVNHAGNRTVGTGVVVSVRDGFAYVLTAEHVAANPEDREVQFFTRKSYPLPARKVRGVKVLAKYATADFSVLKVAVGKEPPPTVALAGVHQRPKSFPFDGISVGCSDGNPPTCRAESVLGKKLAYRPMNSVAFFWELAVAPQAGRSGGPLLDAQGRVIGLGTAHLDQKGYYVHLDEILAGLKRDELLSLMTRGLE